VEPSANGKVAAKQMYDCPCAASEQVSAAT
jgi:hypothetical protein